MKNSTESPNFLDREGKERKKHRTAWGNNDFKSLIRENMKDFEERKDNGK